MRREFFALSSVLIMFLMINIVSGSAIFIDCEFNAEIFGDDFHSFLKVLSVNEEQCEGEVKINEIYMFNDSSKKIKNGMVIQVQEQGACPLAPEGVSTCSNWWTTNYTSYPIDEFNIGILSCQSDEDCSPYGAPSGSDCGGCEGDVCSEYIPLNCYLYENQVGCIDNTCISNGVIEPDTTIEISLWQKILNWFKNLFS